MDVQAVAQTRLHRQATLLRGRAGQFSLCQPQYRADLGSDYVDVRLAPRGKIFRIILVQHSAIRWPVWPRYLDQALAEAQTA